jgi:putative two-component system response regulator
MICDDSITNVSMLKSLLECNGYEDIRTETDPRNLIYDIEEHGCDLLVLDLEMPFLNGYDVLKLVRDEKHDEHLPILMLTGRQEREVRNKALQQGANDFVNKPFDETEILLRVKNLLQVHASYKMQKNLTETLERKVQERTQELEIAADDLISKLALAGEFRDNETGNHVKRVCLFSRLIAKAYGLPDHICQMIEQAAPMHDIGKIGIPDSILLKPGPLNDEERQIMESHAEVGAKILDQHGSHVVQMGRTIALSHHEKWDGTGYPNNLPGESIPIEGRIVALVDVFDALTSNRPYKKAWSFEKALNFIQDQRGKHFDPTLVDIFCQKWEEIVDISIQFTD